MLSCSKNGIVYILLGIFPASNCSWPTFRNPVSVPSSKAKEYIQYSNHGESLKSRIRHLYGEDIALHIRRLVYIQPLKMELTQGSETSANHNLTPGKYPKEYIQYSNHGESLKSSISYYD